MKKQLIFGIVLSAIVLSFGFSFLNSARAGEPIPGVDVRLINGGGLMAPSDLGVDSIGTLPTSNFYFFKQWSRGIQRFFTIDSVAKAQLELNITNQIAAEMLEVEKADPDDAEALKNALENYSNAQERLNTRLAKLTANSENPNVEKLLKEVDEKTAKHTILLEELAEKNTSQLRFEVVGDSLKKAQDNILKTFTVTVTSVNDAPSLKQKAEEQIGRDGLPVGQDNDLLDVSITSVNDAPSLKQKAEEQIERAGVAIVTVYVVSPTGGESNIVDDRGAGFIKQIAKAKEHLTDAKKAFAEGKYGEAYGLARSAEAMVAGIGTILNDDSEVSPKAIIVPVNGDTTQEPDETFSKKKESPKVESPKPSPKPSVSPTIRPTPEKTETPDSAGSPVR